MRFFPSEKIAAVPHGALLRSPAIDALYMVNTEGHSFAAYNAGAKFGFIYFRSGNIRYELSGFGGLFTRFEPFSESFNFIHADFIGGSSFDVNYGRLTFENIVYHNSSHAGDDYMHFNNGEYRNVSYEAIKHYTTINISRISDISIGFEYKPVRRGKEYIFYNKSLFLGSRFNWLTMGIPVFLEWEAEYIGLKHSPNIGIRLGVYLNYLFNVVFLSEEAADKEYHEFAFYYYYGYSKQGYFYNTKENMFLAGPTYRF